MQKLINRLLLFSGVVGTLFVTSCNNDKGEDPVPGPTLTLVTSPSIVDDTVTLKVNEELIITVNATAPAGFNVARISGAGLSLELNRNDLGIDAGVSTATAEFDPVFFENTGFATLTASVVDENSESVEESFVVEVVGEPIDEYTAVLLGGQINSSTGSFYNSIDNAVYKLSAAGTNDDMVDLLFYYVNSEGKFNIIASADNDQAQTTFETDPDGTGPLTAPGWPLTTETSTRFKPVGEGFDFDATTTSSGLASAYSEVGDDQERMLDLQVDEVFAFRTDATRGSRYGIIRVASVDGTSGSDRSITLDVKIQSEDN